jgi:hypothetical protein
MKTKQIKESQIGGHTVVISYGNDRDFVLTIARDAHFTQSWVFVTYDRALAVMEWLNDLTEYQRDVLILDVQLVLDKLERVTGRRLDDTQG